MPLYFVDLQDDLDDSQVQGLSATRRAAQLNSVNKVQHQPREGPSEVSVPGPIPAPDSQGPRLTPPRWGELSAARILASMVVAILQKFCSNSESAPGFSLIMNSSYGSGTVLSGSEGKHLLSFVRNCGKWCDMASFRFIIQIDTYVSYPTLCNPMDCSLPDSSVHGARQHILEMPITLILELLKRLSWLCSPTRTKILPFSLP
ncbi:PREDICTED: uncharacterized protein LOC102191534 isoform X2 [Capra hircus]|uniref:uncharacterized protein LOC102191534 isoform X2 n=1 Tax=Capra hircus TaxID=9925 RepID=UPI000846BD45|nr:PREDICTED: uncharacterized protein LOC102191534 isoform X2 [Capra hircus]